MPWVTRPWMTPRMRTAFTHMLSFLRSACDRCMAPPVTGWLGGLAFVTGVVVALALSVDSLRARVHAPVHSVTIRFLDAPSWVGDSLHDHLTSLAAPWLLGTTLDRVALINARESLIASGCFADVMQVRRGGSSVVEIVAVFLKPRARVLDVSGPLLVDREGFVLPAGYRIGDTTHLVHILNPAYAAPDTPASRWLGDDMNASLQLLDTLDGQEWFSQITAIDLGDYDMQRQLVLVTELGTRILWGSPPGRETVLEALTHEKIERLTWLHTYHGRIDQHHRGEIDVTDASIVIKR